MKYRMVNHTLKISQDCKDAIKLLKSKGVKPDRFFREGGEKLVIEIAEKYKRPKLVKIKDKYVVKHVNLLLINQKIIIMLFKEDFTKDLKALVFSERQSKKSVETKLGLLLNKYSELIKKCSEDFLDYGEYQHALKFQKQGFARLYDLNTYKYVYLSKDSIHCMQPESSGKINRRCTIILESGQEIVINQLICAMELFLF